MFTPTVVLLIALYLILLLAAVVIAKFLFEASYRRVQKNTSVPPLPQEPEKETLTSLQQLIQAQPGSFWIIIAIMAVGMSSLVLYFKRKGWF